MPAAGHVASLTFDAASCSVGANALTMHFPTALQIPANSFASVSDLSIPITFKNITAAYYNNRLAVQFLGATLALTLPDGIYTVASLSTFLQQQMAAQGWYLQSTTGGAPMYFIALSNNAAFSEVELDITPVPTSAPAGFQQPPNATWSYPSTAQCPQLVVPAPTTNLLTGQPYATSMSAFLGYPAGSYPATPQAGQFSTLGSTPALNPVRCVQVSCQHVSNLQQANNSQQLFSFVPTTSYGSVQDDAVKVQRWSPIQSGTFQTLSLSFSDQNNQPLQGLVLSNVLVSLQICQRDGAAPK